MCVSLGPATFSSTIVYAHATVFRGRRVHVLGYQNNAKSKVRGPNAMILPIPASVAMGPENAIDTRGFASVLRDYVQSLRRARVRSIEPVVKAPPTAGGVQVFERGSYAIVLASDASAAAMMTAMNSLPEAKRPPIDRAMFDAYLSWYPGWHLAICCFEGHVVAEPMLWWYEPMTPDELFLPGLDAHDGGVPDLAARVKLDHAIVVGIGNSPLSVSATLPVGVPAEIGPLLATRIDGWFHLAGRCPNGDWWMRPEALERDHIEPVDPLVRRLPPGARSIASPLR
jgi:hypothetical protein